MPSGIGAVAGGAEGPAEPGVGPVGDDHVAGPHDLGGAGVGPAHDRAVERPRARAPGPIASVAGQRVAPAFTARVGDHLVELAAPHHVPVGREVGVLGPGQLEGDAVGDRPQPVEALELRERVGETHVVELADRPRSQPVAARLLAREALLLDDEHAVARAPRASSAAAAPDGPAPTTSTS